MTPCIYLAGFYHEVIKIKIATIQHLFNLVIYYICIYTFILKKRFFGPVLNFLSFFKASTLKIFKDSSARIFEFVYTAVFHRQICNYFVNIILEYICKHMKYIQIKYEKCWAGTKTWILKVSDPVNFLWFQEFIIRLCNFLSSWALLSGRLHVFFFIMK